MKPLKLWLSCWSLFVLAVGAFSICAETHAPESPVSLRKAPRQVVLYTIHRGSYDKAGAAVGRLFALAGQKGLVPQGAVSFTYLNNPQLVSEEHYLTEIRLPVADAALKLAGTLGEMTDVKELPPMDLAVIAKPEGQADPAPLFEQLMSWVLENEYQGVDGPSEVFLSSVGAADYAKMRTELTMPVVKLPARPGAPVAH